MINFDSDIEKQLQYYRTVVEYFSLKYTANRHKIEGRPELSMTYEEMAYKIKQQIKEINGL
jgi:hypothetical protein